MYSHLSKEDREKMKKASVKNSDFEAQVEQLRATLAGLNQVGSNTFSVLGAALPSFDKIPNYPVRMYAGSERLAWELITADCKEISSAPIPVEKVDKLTSALLRIE